MEGRVPKVLFHAGGLPGFLVPLQVWLESQLCSALHSLFPRLLLAHFTFSSDPCNSAKPALCSWQLVPSPLTKPRALQASSYCDQACLLGGVPSFTSTHLSTWDWVLGSQSLSTPGPTAF